MTNLEKKIAACLTKIQAQIIMRRAEAMIEAGTNGSKKLKGADCLLCVECGGMSRTPCGDCRLKKAGLNSCVNLKIGGYFASSVKINLTHHIGEEEQLDKFQLAWLKGVVAICKYRITVRIP